MNSFKPLIRSSFLHYTAQSIEGLDDMISLKYSELHSRFSPVLQQYSCKRILDLHIGDEKHTPTEEYNYY